MCGFCGYINKNDDIIDDNQIKLMNDTLKKRGPNEYNIYLEKKVALGHTRLSIIDVTYGSQPMIKIVNNHKYIIVYNGELYNSQELKKDLENKGYDFKTKCDTEVILTSYIEYGVNSILNFNGIFSFAIYDLNKKQIFLGRDRLGIKPLFYTITNTSSPCFIFASEIKALLAHKDVKPILDKDGLKELFGIGPSHSPGLTYFKNIFEIKPGYCGIFKNFELTTYQYWDLKTLKNYDNENDAIAKVHDLVIDATKKQLVSDVGICTMLSGGLDSSILTKIAKDNISDLKTFSIDFKNNNKDFTPNIYQSSKDSDFVEIIKNYLHTNHKTILIDNSYSFDLLRNSLIARDVPGMADIDTSMLAFCDKIRDNGFKVCISGECSDEIFGGYPWFYREHLVNHVNGFPWALSENLRNSLLKKNILKETELAEYISQNIRQTLKNVKYLDDETQFEKRFRDINYLTIKYFMIALLERTDRMSMFNSLEVRVPFADHRIFEYVYNLPASLKLGLLNNNTEPIEKYILRKAFKNELPNSIVYRKKSPFPKTYDPNYLKLVEKAVF
jgi:asparagine synthase (glutamine-hydrolysing)